jgi:hypothetical protein
VSTTSVVLLKVTAAGVRATDLCIYIKIKRISPTSKTVTWANYLRVNLTAAVLFLNLECPPEAVRCVRIVDAYVPLKASAAHVAVDAEVRLLALPITVVNGLALRAQLLRVSATCGTRRGDGVADLGAKPTRSASGYNAWQTSATALRAARRSSWASSTDSRTACESRCQESRTVRSRSKHNGI